MSCLSLERVVRRYENLRSIGRSCKTGVWYISLIGVLILAAPVIGGDDGPDSLRSWIAAFNIGILLRSWSIAAAITKFHFGQSAFFIEQAEFTVKALIVVLWVFHFRFSYNQFSVFFTLFQFAVTIY